MQKLAIIGLVVLTTPTFAATLVVDEQGNGDYITIQAAADAAQPGDLVLVRAGTYSGATITSSGQPGNRITFQADPSGSQPVVTSHFDFTDESYVTVDGFYMNGATFVGAYCSFIEILNNTIDKSGQGITNIAPGTDILICGNTFVNLTNDVVNQWGRRWVIRNNIATGITDINDEHLDFWQTWCGDYRPDADPADFALVENNLYADVYGPNVHFFLFNQTALCGSDQGHNYIIRYNKIRNIGETGVVFDNGTGAPGYQGIAVYNNVFGDLRNGTFVSWQDYIGSIKAVGDTGYFLNNILYDAVDPSGAEAIYPPSIPAHHSLVFDQATLVTMDGALESSTGSIINQSPLFQDYGNNDFALSASSPAIDAGGELTTVSATDAGTGPVLTVEAAWFFQDGWAGVDADWIAVGSATNIAQIVSIDYSTQVITLTASLTRSTGDPVYLFRDSDGTQVLHGTAPDIGAVERNDLAPTSAPPRPPSNLTVL